MSDTTLKIALIDDSPGDAFWFQVILKEMNVPAHVQRFTTGVDALAFFQQNPPPDLIVSDWVLPMLAFPDFVSSVRNLSGYAQTPIALVTGADPTLYRKEAEQLGILCCLQKPVDPPQLQRLLDLLRFHFSQTA